MGLSKIWIKQILYKQIRGNYGARNLGLTKIWIGQFFFNILQEIDLLFLLLCPLFDLNTFQVGNNNMISYFLQKNYVQHWSIV